MCEVFVSVVRVLKVKSSVQKISVEQKGVTLLRREAIQSIHASAFSDLSEKVDQIGQNPKAGAIEHSVGNSEAYLQITRYQLWRNITGCRKKGPGKRSQKFRGYRDHFLRKGRSRNGRRSRDVTVTIVMIVM
jgi:hypothetical protein